MATIDSTPNDWKLRLEGRMMGYESEEDILSSGSNAKRFLNFFEKIRIEFPQKEYPPVDWVKAKSDVGSAFDCIEIVRHFPKDLPKKTKV